MNIEKLAPQSGISIYTYTIYIYVLQVLIPPSWKSHHLCHCQFECMCFGIEM